MATGKQTSTESLVSVHLEFSKAVVATEMLLVVMVVGWSGCLQGFLEAGIQKWDAASHLLPIPSPPPTLPTTPPPAYDPDRDSGNAAGV